MFSFLNDLTPDAITHSLSTECPPVVDLPDDSQALSIRRAAVLIPLIRAGNRWEIIYIRRALNERDRHSGQVAFAGGMWAAVDQSMTETALREAWEEIGLIPDDVSLLGRLGCHHSIGGIEITPVVATIPWPYSFRPDPSEVAQVFSIPLVWLANPAHYEIRDKNWKRVVKTVYYKPYEGENLWGATARMTLSLISRLTAMKNPLKHKP